MISKLDTEKLSAFAKNCRSALLLLELGDRNLITLDNRSTQQSIVTRLGDELLSKWVDKERNHLDEHRELPFRVFVRWITEQSGAYLRLQERSLMERLANLQRAPLPTDQARHPRKHEVVT